MFRITFKKPLNSSVTMMRVLAPSVAEKVKAGQFVVLRADSKGERIPLTVSNANAATGEVTVIFQVVGNSTEILNSLEVGDTLLDFVGPLGEPTSIDVNAKRVCVIGGGVGNAIAYPQAKAYFEEKVPVDVIAGYRNKGLVILESEMSSVCDNFYLVTDDGSYGEKGFVTTKLQQLIDAGKEYDVVFAVGPAVMMRAVCNLTKVYGIKTVVSLNPIMVDGIGMCGGCRVTVGGKVKFACVDGPDFDGHEVDFDELVNRNKMYDEHPKTKRHRCNLTGEVK